MAAPRLHARRAAGVAGCGAVLLLMALLFDASPLFVPAVGLILLGLLAPAWVLITARGAFVTRRLPAERVVEEEPLAATLEVRRGWLGLPGAEIHDPFTGTRLDVGALLSLRRGERVAGIRVLSRFPRRGRISLPTPRLVVTDPLGLAQVHSTGAAPAQQLLVLPATERVRWTSSSRGQRLEAPDAHSISEALAATDLDGLRPYRPGTSASRIHWPALARGAGLIERRLRADGDSRPLVVLDARLPGPETAETTALLDAAVRAAASLTLELARAGGCGLLLPGDQRATPIDRELANWPAAYARLALVRSAGARAPALAHGGGRLGPMIYVTVRVPERLLSQAGEIGRGAVLLVVPNPCLVGDRPAGLRGAARPTLSVSGCAGFVLGARREPDRPRAAERTPA
jgi:uncharacterized protein (DUF58 family)